MDLTQHSVTIEHGQVGVKPKSEDETDAKGPVSKDADVTKDDIVNRDLKDDLPKKGRTKKKKQ